MRGGLEGVFQEVGLDVGVDRDQIEQIERAPVPAGAGRGRSVGDPFHLLEVFRVESAQEEGIGQEPQVLPGVERSLAAAIAGDLADEPRDLGCHQPAVLVAAFVGLAFDVQDDPAGLGVAITGPEPLLRSPGRAERAPHSLSARDHRPGPGPVPRREA